MGTLVIGSGSHGESGNNGESGNSGAGGLAHSLGRRRLLLGAGAAMLGSACGAAEDYESGEAIDGESIRTVEQAAVDFSSVPSWSWSTINNFFVFARDLRWLSGARRVTWLYPDGGCEARAEIICHRAGISFLTKPYKLYAAGALKFYTDYAPKGKTYVNWGFHIAPVVKSSATGYVYMLDPSIYPYAPLRLNTWLAKINGHSNGIVLNPSNYWGPLGSGNIDTAIDQMEDEYLDLEWDRLVSLGRNPREELGDNPPWA